MKKKLNMEKYIRKCFDITGISETCEKNIDITKKSLLQDILILPHLAVALDIHVVIMAHSIAAIVRQ